ncbi:MAG: SDR family oxidoreductase, partial [Spirochaetia bacterium]|nr:SDR family oxidoreductase [Spirochaetia bacterium]
GAGSGIGQRIAVALAEAGSEVGCFDLHDNEGLAETVQRIQGCGKRALKLIGDVTQYEDLLQAVQRVEKELGPLVAAVNSAGIANAVPAEEMDETVWDMMLDIDLKGVFLSCKAEAQVMLPRKTGSIINIASMSGVIVNRGLLQAHYNTAKAGVIHLTKSLAMEWVKKGIRVNAISPGYTLTPMNIRPEVAEQRKIFESETPMGRMAEVDEMAGPAVFLASNASSYCTGLNLLVDGGFVCW